MDFTLPEHLPGLLADMDTFIEREIAPLQAENMQYFDQRREHARTDWDNDGIPTREWEDLLSEMRRRADKAGWLRYGLPASTRSYLHPLADVDHFGNPSGPSRSVSRGQGAIVANQRIGLCCRGVGSRRQGGAASMAPVHYIATIARRCPRMPGPLTMVQRAPNPMRCGA